jgi:hypothetical protein
MDGYLPILHPQYFQVCGRKSIEAALAARTAQTVPHLPSQDDGKCRYKEGMVGQVR